jgi:hypothetical protein
MPFGATTALTAIPESFSIRRNAGVGIHRLTEVFVGLENSPALAGQFKTRKDMDEFIEHATATIMKSDGYMFIDPQDGSVVISMRYLAEGDERDLYLDIVHELVHVRQWLEGKDLYDRRYDYAKRPTESEAYSIVVTEAKRIGMTGKEILEYLRVPWISKKALEEMAKHLGIRI